MNDCSKVQPISKKILLNFIAEFYNSKDNKNQMLLKLQKPVQFVNDFFFSFMKEKFQIKTVFKDNIEALIKSILKYAGNFNFDIYNMNFYL